jgi:hypothetical protein
MATSESSAAYHTCGCGAEFDTTDELLEHARSEHGTWVH